MGVPGMDTPGLFPMKSIRLPPNSIFPCASQFVASGIMQAKNKRVVEAIAIASSGQPD
jgi:hypothetical protein